MKINYEKLKDAGVEIIEEIYDVRLERPIDLRSLDGFNIDALDYGNYEIIPEDEEEYADNSTTFFSIYENGENVLLSCTLNDLKDYLLSKGFYDEN